MFSWLKYIFSIDTKSTNRVIIRFLGIKFKHTKSGVLRSKNEYKNCSVSEIPKATGVLRLTQLADLKMLKIFDKLCKDYGFEYWLDFGNLLGAVRHKGFIPWDDDVDIGMLRDDYERFIELFKNGIPQYPDFYLKFNNNGYNKCFVKLLHKKFQNINVDIFPYDLYHEKIDDNKKVEITSKIKKIVNSKLNHILQLLYITRPNAIRKRFKKDTEKQILKFHKTDRINEPALFYGIDYPHKYNNIFFDYDKIFPLNKILFEDYEFPCPNDYDFVLKQTFKNYMELPDVFYPQHTNSEALNYSKELEKFINE